MPLNDPEIEAAVERYRREMDRYAKLVELVGSACRELVSDNAIPATVQSRVKDPERLRGKLRKRRAEYATTDEVFETLKDLAAVRIVTYVESDRSRVAAEVGKRFDAIGDGHIVKDQPDSYYRATHCQVRLLEDDLATGNENLRGDVCEVQICSLLAHVWNEIEHDLGYKPLSGNLSDREQRALDALGDLTRAGDNTIANLLEATDTRLAASDGAFKDLWDFVARSRKFFPKSDNFGDHSGQLFAELLAEGLDTPAKIESALLPDLPRARQRAAELIERFQAHLTDDHVVRSVEPSSSDPLLMLLMEQFAAEVLARHPGGKGKGRPPRVASIARRFLEMQAS